jgi:hypothetical protein
MIVNEHIHTQRPVHVYIHTNMCVETYLLYTQWQSLRRLKGQIHQYVGIPSHKIEMYVGINSLDRI